MRRGIKKQGIERGKKGKGNKEEEGGEKRWTKQEEDEGKLK